MRTILKISCLVSITVFLSGCLAMYPIRDRLNPVNGSVPEGYTFDYDKNNFFQLRIKQRLDYLNVGSQSLVSDIPYKSFEQDVVPQDEVRDTMNLRVEETYIYLDNLIPKDKSADIRCGYGFYCVTYPTIDDHRSEESPRTRKYFNQPDSLFSNIIRSIQVGYWIKNSNNDVLMIFQDKDDNINVFEAINEGNFIGITRVSHPSDNNKRIKGFDAFGQLHDDIRNGIGTLSTDQIDELYDNILNSMTLINLKDVFDLNGKGYLMFYNIPDSKKFIYQKEEKNDWTIEEFTISKKDLYFKVSKNSNTQNYQFEPCRVYFIDDSRVN